MEIVHAVYENGVFRPTSDVSLPERCEVEFEPKVVGQAAGSQESQATIYEIFSRSYETGQRDVAARHDEHQP